MMDDGGNVKKNICKMKVPHIKAMNVSLFLFKHFSMLFVVKETPLGPKYHAKIKGNLSDLLIDFKNLVTS